MTVEERLLKYVSYWTTSDENSTNIPSSKREFALAELLEEELKALHLSNVTLTDHCYVYGLLPATKGMESKKSVGFISHIDTAPDFNGKDVKPQIINNYDGGDVLLEGTGRIPQGIRFSNSFYIKRPHTHNNRWYFPSRRR